MKTTQNTQQSRPLGPIVSAVCYELARMNPATFASRPREEALAAIRIAIDRRPGNSTPAECQAAARRAQTARAIVAKIEAAPYYYPELFADALAAFGLDSRTAVVGLLRAYHRTAWHRARCEALKAETAARRAMRSLNYPEGEKLSTAERRQLRLRSQAVAVAARDAARPQVGATAEENARARAGYAKLKAAGAFD